MSIKKMMLLATTAIAAMAFAVPAGASASGMFYHNGAELKGTANVNFSGGIAFFTGLGGIECVGHAEAELKTSSGSVKSLVITTSTCKGFGAFAGCKVIGDEPTTPWALTPTANVIDLQGVVIHNEFEEIAGGPGCGAEFATINFENVTLTPNDKTKIGSVTVSGEGIVEVFGLELEAEALGALSVTSGNSGTYGISV